MTSDGAKLLHVPVTLDVGPTSSHAQGEQSQCRVIALWLLQHHPDDRERALDVVLTVLDDAYPDRPVGEREQATRRLRDMVAREFADIAFEEMLVDADRSAERQYGRQIAAYVKMLCRNGWSATEIEEKLEAYKVEAAVDRERLRAEMHRELHAWRMEGFAPQDFTKPQPPPHRLQ